MRVPSPCDQPPPVLKQDSGWVSVRACVLCSFLLGNSLPAQLQCKLLWSAPLPPPFCLGFIFACLPYSLSLVCKGRMLARLRRTSDLWTHGQTALFVAELGSDLPHTFPALQNSQCHPPGHWGTNHIRLCITSIPQEQREGQEVPGTQAWP